MEKDHDCSKTAMFDSYNKRKIPVPHCLVCGGVAWDLVSPETENETLEAVYEDEENE